MSKSSELDTLVKQHILDSIYSEAYGVETPTNVDKVEFLRNTFHSEKSYEIKRVGRQQALEDWFRGLPTACTVEFSDYNIVELAKEWGYLGKDASEAECTKITNNWWRMVAAKTCQLFDGYRVPKDKE